MNSANRDASYGSATFSGQGSGNSSYTANASCGFGFNTLHVLGAGHNSTAVGYQSMLAQVNGTDCTAVGNASLSAMNGGNYNTVVGSKSMQNDASSSFNNSFGYNSLNTQNGGAGGNCAFGYNTLLGITIGGSNCAFGNSAGQVLTTQADNSFFGTTCGFGVTGDQNTIAGSQACYFSTTQNYATVMGFKALYGNSGNYNTAIGYGAHGNAGMATTGSYNTSLGYNSANNYIGAETSNILIGNTGTAAENNVIRIGTQGTGNAQQNTCFIAGITGATVTGAAVLCSTSGQLGTVVSSERYKQKIKDIDQESLMRLRPVSFEYKSNIESGIHYGFIAEEVQQVFPNLVVTNHIGEPETVKYHEMTALLLKEIQSLNKRLSLIENGVK